MTIVMLSKAVVKSVELLSRESDGVFAAMFNKAVVNANFSVLTPCVRPCSHSWHSFSICIPPPS